MANLKSTLPASTSAVTHSPTESATARLIDEERRMLCLTSIWELDKIARTLPTLLPQDGDQTYYLVKALAGRMLRLTGAIMAGLDDSFVKNEEIKAIVHFDDLANSQG